MEGKSALSESRDGYGRCLSLFLSFPPSPPTVSTTSVIWRRPPIRGRPSVWRRTSLTRWSPPPTRSWRTARWRTIVVTARRPPPPPVWWWPPTAWRGTISRVRWRPPVSRGRPSITAPRRTPRPRRRPVATRRRIASPVMPRRRWPTIMSRRGSAHGHTWRRHTRTCDRRRRRRRRRIAPLRRPCAADWSRKTWRCGPVLICNRRRGCEVRGECDKAEILPRHADIIDLAILLERIAHVLLRLGPKQIANVHSHIGLWCLPGNSHHIGRCRWIWRPGSAPPTRSRV